MSTKGKSSSSRRGLLAGGNWIVDQVKLIDVYPNASNWPTSAASFKAPAAPPTTF
jgi:hypothetical protein